MLRTLLLSLVASLALAQSIVEDLSFGHKQPISPNAYSIPGWSILGEGHVPQILSDKVVMTPIVGGNKRGALWSENQNKIEEWTVDFDFRASGQDRSGGNLQLWYVKDGNRQVSTGSLYTTRKFEGLAIVIDAVGGVQKIRGFLNDGNTDYKSHHTVESLAFGHCDYAYRNQGRPSKLQLKYGSTGLAVTIDGNPCFSTPQVTLPTDYTFGVTAASSDPPDSFEVFRFEVNKAPSLAQFVQQRTGSDNPGSPTPRSSTNNADTNRFMTLQFNDLHDRVQALAKAVDSLSLELQISRSTQKEILDLLRSSNVQGNIDSKLNNVDRLVSEIHQDLKSTDHKREYARLNQQIEKTHQGIVTHVPGVFKEYVQNHTPRIGFIAFSFMAFQSCCLAVLLFQKYRKSTMPKKFL